MNIIICQNGEPINRIVADEAFAAGYCARHGYTYEIEPEPPQPEPPPPEPTLEEIVGTLLGV